MKIYAYDTPGYDIDDFIGQPVWVKCNFTNPTRNNDNYIKFIRYRYYGHQKYVIVESLNPEFVDYNIAFYDSVDEFYNSQDRKWRTDAYLPEVFYKKYEIKQPLELLTDDEILSMVVRNYTSEE